MQLTLTNGQCPKCVNSSCSSTPKHQAAQSENGRKTCAFLQRHTEASRHAERCPTVPIRGEQIKTRLCKTHGFLVRKLETELLYDPGVPSPERTRRESHGSVRYKRASVHGSAAYDGRNTEQPGCASAGRRTDGHTMKRHLAVKRNKTVPCAETRVDLEIVTLSEVSQTEIKHRTVLLTRGI